MARSFSRPGMTNSPFGLRSSFLISSVRPSKTRPTLFLSSSEVSAISAMTCAFVKRFADMFVFLLSTWIDNWSSTRQRRAWFWWGQYACGGASAPPEAASTQKRVAFRFRVPQGKNSLFIHFAGGAPTHVCDLAQLDSRLPLVLLRALAGS